MDPENADFGRARERGQAPFDKAPFRIVVVGGGFAGLAAATRLAERGRQVLVLEARARLGGRATAFPDRDSGEIVDNGQHVMFGCYRDTLAFLRRIDALPNVEVQRALDVPFIAPDGRRSRLACPPWPAPLHLLGGILRWTAVPFADRLSALRLAPALLRARGRTTAELDAATRPQSVDAWLRAHGQSPKLIAALWEPLAIAALNQPTAHAAAAPFVRVLAEMFGRDPLASALVLPRTPLDEMYARPARAYIEARGGEVRTGALARVQPAGDGRLAVDVRTAAHGAPERIDAAAVVAAVPWHALRNLLPDPPASLSGIIADAARMPSMPIVTVNLWYDRVVMDEPFVGLEGRTIQWIFDKRRVFGEQASHLSLVVSAAETVAPLGRDALVDIAAREVAAALPAARTARLVRATVVRERQATFSLHADAPPRPANRTPVPGLVLAGDWTDTGLPSTIESAVVSGHRAADLVAMR
jgi:squalene-associated FAD-dependent desaturase